MKHRWIQGKNDLADVDAIRHAVFVVEQGVSPVRVSDGDDSSLHLVLYDEGGAPIATGRLSADFALQRIAVLRRERGKGKGERVTRMLVEKARQMGALRVTLSSQAHAIKFYEGLGFEICSDRYIDAGIVHVTMSMSLSS